MNALELKQFVLNALELDCDCTDGSCDEVYGDTEYLMHLNSSLRGIGVDMLGKNLTSYSNLKKKVIDIFPATVLPGRRGYQGRYKLPDDVLKLVHIKVSLDGQCWKEAVVQYTDKKFEFIYKCNVCEDCDCDLTCGVQIQIVNNYLEIKPLPEKKVPKGLVIWYEALPGQIKDIDEELPFTEIDADYLAMLVTDYYMAVHADKFSNTKVNRLFNKFNRAKNRFDKLHNMQTRGRVQKRHTGPYL